MSAAPPSDATGLQWVFNLVGLGALSLLGALWRALQLQIRDVKSDVRDLKSDAKAGDEAIRREMTERVDQRFDALDERDEERRRVNAERHADNQSEMERNRQASLAINDTVVVMDQRISAALDRLTREVAALPSRPEVRDMVNSAVHSGR